MRHRARYTEDNAGQYHVYTVVPELGALAFAIVAIVAPPIVIALGQIEKKIVCQNPFFLKA